MNSSNRSSSSNSEHLNFQPNNPFDDPNGEVELAMDIDVCGSSTSGSDHCFSTASVSIISDSESQELSDLEENDSESSSNHSDRGGAIVNIEQALENPRDHEEDAIDGEEEENLLEFFSDSSESVIDERDFESSSDEEEVESIPNEEQVDVDDLFQYPLEEPILIVIDDDSEVASENGEELVEAAIDDEPNDVDQSEVASEHSNDLPKYSTEDHSWVEYDSDEDMAEYNDEGEFEETTLDEEHNEADQSEISSLESGNDLPMDDSVSIPTSDSIAENNGNVETSVSSSSELRRKEEFIQTAPFASTASDYEPSLTTSEDAEFRVFIQRTRELEARVDVQEVAAEVHEVAPELLALQAVVVGQPIGFGIGETQLDVVIGNSGILPQLPSYQITHDWLHNFQNHF